MAMRRTKKMVQMVEARKLSVQRQKSVLLKEKFADKRYEWYDKEKEVCTNVQLLCRF